MKPALILFLLIAAFSSLAPKPEAVPDLQIEMKVYSKGKLQVRIYQSEFILDNVQQTVNDWHTNKTYACDSLIYSISRPGKYNPLQNWK